MSTGTKQTLFAVLLAALLVPVLWIVINNGEQQEKIPDKSTIGIQTFHQLAASVKTYREKHGHFPNLVDNEPRNEFFDRYGNSELTRLLTPPDKNKEDVVIQSKSTTRQNWLVPVYNPFLIDPENSLKDTDIIAFSPVYTDQQGTTLVESYVVLYADGKVESLDKMKWETVKEKNATWTESN